MIISNSLEKMLVQPLEELYNYLLGNRLRINGYPQEGQTFALSEMIFPHSGQEIKTILHFYLLFNK